MKTLERAYWETRAALRENGIKNASYLAKIIVNHLNKFELFDPELDRKRAERAEKARQLALSREETKNFSEGYEMERPIIPPINLDE